MASGKVKWFNNKKGFGFIVPDDGGSDVFVHATALAAAGVKTLADGQALSYSLKEERGRVFAVDLKLS